MIRRVAYIAGMEKYARDLEEFGFELFPYTEGVSYDAVIYDGIVQKGILKKFKTGSNKMFILNIHSLSPGSAANKLKTRLYSSLFE